MRLVLLQSAIQNPKSRIQNRVSALRRSELGHGRGQAIGARMHGSAPWKTEETIVGLPCLLVLSVFSRSDFPNLVAVTFHLDTLSALLTPYLPLEDRPQTGFTLVGSQDCATSFALDGVSSNLNRSRISFFRSSMKSSKCSNVQRAGSGGIRCSSR